eukprot:m.197404 g.197404  ORF g.197404 m.197404 type:complete len:230 (+) comp18345_c1_seq2:184-873(+)
MMEELNAQLDAMSADLTAQMRQPNNEDPPRASDIFGKCFACEELVVGKENGCVALGNVWHKHCFVCDDCGASLSAGEFFESKGKIYCQGDYLRREGPTCTACSQSMTERILSAPTGAYHPECFVCIVCQTGLDGRPFIPHDEQPFCRTCWHKKYGAVCARCQEFIVPGPDGKARCMKAIGNSYHPQCFSCEDCNQPFTTSEKSGAYPFEGRLFCYNHAMARAQAAMATQ